MIRECDHIGQSVFLQHDKLKDFETYDLRVCEKCGEILVDFYHHGFNVCTISELVDAKKVENSLYALLIVKRRIE